jgi:hypothetical protein
MLDFTTVMNVLPFFASAGGGGSGGSGGGGGGGGIFALAFFIGYGPMHVLGARIRRIHKAHPDLYVLMQILAWGVCVLYAGLILVITHGGILGLGFIAAAGAFVGLPAGFYDWFDKLRTNKRAEAALTAAESKDPAVWGEDAVKAATGAIFMRYQQSWSGNDVSAMQPYMTPHYYQHATLMVEALKQAGRRDDMQNVKILETAINDLYDAPDNSQDWVVVGFKAQAQDHLVDASTGALLLANASDFMEFWLFQRSNNAWLLNGIQPATADTWRANPTLEQFAASNGYFYSLDWGRQLLPQHGQLFGGGKFGVSDINNHVIGLYNQQLIVQLYTYAPNARTAGDSYLIAQAILPRSYGDIVVRHKAGLHMFGIRGLTEVSTEWPDFNKKYQVYATSPEQATSLELLNPVYMEQLEATPFEVNIEVVDNTVYLYAPLGAAADAGQYQAMLNLLLAAFKEMRM